MINNERLYWIEKAAYNVAFCESQVKRFEGRAEASAYVVDRLAESRNDLECLKGYAEEAGISKAAIDGAVKRGMNEFERWCKK